MRHRFIWAALVILAVPANAIAKGPLPSVEFTQSADQAAGKPIPLTLEALSALPQITQTVTFKTSNGHSTATYKGPLLWDVLKSTGALNGLEHNAELAKVLLATGADGYQIAYSIGELSPDFGNAMILLAVEVDGKPLPQGFQIVAQGDKRGARALHDLTKIELR